MAIIVVANQNEFEALSRSVDKLDYFDEHIIELKGSSFELDGSLAWLQEPRKISLRGLGINETTLVLKNFPKDNPHYDSTDDLVATWSTVDTIAVTNLLLVAPEMTQISFWDSEEFKRWENVGFDTSLVAVVILQDAVDDFLSFLEEYDVEGVVEIGDHLIVGRGVYTHHGVYVGRSRVIHYTERGVERTTLEDFCRSNRFWVYVHEARLSREETVRRAESRLGEDKYHLFNNNCEHFAWWCCTQEHWSHQVFGGLLLGNLANQANVKRYRLQEATEKLFHYGAILAVAVGIASFL